MFTSIDKALVALIMAAIYLLNAWTPLSFGVDEATVATVIGLLTPLLVYVVPNKARG
jgi:tryptophan-rich sensory protein